MGHSRTAAEIRHANVRYHDAAADEYDAKWGIDFGELGESQVVAKLERALGPNPGPFEHALEIGAGTGYFTLNLMRAGVIKKATCCDVSPGMLKRLQFNAEYLGLEVETVTANAEKLPFEDEQFDLVFGHAVLHHIVDLPHAFREFHRVLAPRGSLAFAGEPSRYGHRVASVPKTAALIAAPVWRLLMGAPPAQEPEEHLQDGHELEGIVDVHSFSPGELRTIARDSGFADVEVHGEELTANLFGWFNRTLEATADPDSVPLAWRQYAYHGYLLLQKLDRKVLETRLPAASFYNLVLAGKRPAGTKRRRRTRSTAKAA
jgi:ubiquinone/menaquinone biosynthesis C-methylase UbiE